MSVFLYVANIIGYIRLGCLFIGIKYIQDPLIFMNFYVASYALDAVDGPIARALQGTSKFGSVLDMVTDRISTAVLLALLQKPVWLYIMILDISAHWVHYSASLLKGQQSHKQSENKILNWYYKRQNLFVICFLSEAFLCANYLFEKSQMQIPLEVFLLTAPAFLFKQIINIIHIYKGSKDLVAAEKITQKLKN